METKDPLRDITKKHFNIDDLFPYQRLVISNILEAAGAELTAHMLRERLGRDNIFFYHAGLSREEKSGVERWFYASEDGILIATIVFGIPYVPYMY